jgi:hypothetical protein
MVVRHEIPPEYNLRKIVEALIGELERQEVLEASDIQTKIIERGNPKTTKEKIAEKFGFKGEGETPPD